MNLKKYLPFILLGLGLLVVVAGFFILKGGKKEVVEEEAAPEIPFDQRPFASLTPSEDGHWLKMRITNLVFAADSLDYELLYTLPDGRTQGVPGTVKLTGGKEIERDLLLGSESSGKFRYDEGVEKGTLSLKFRDTKGKLAGKLSSEFHLQTKTDKLSSVDGVFGFELDEEPEEGFFVTMNTFGVAVKTDGGVLKGPYGVFSSNQGEIPGSVDLGGGKVYFLDTDEWVELTSNASDNIGVFVSK